MSEYGERWIKGPQSQDYAALAASAAWSSTWKPIGDGSWGWQGRWDRSNKIMRAGLTVWMAFLSLFFSWAGSQEPSLSAGFRVGWALLVAFWVVLLPFSFADVRARMEVGDPGVTVVNRWHTHRYHWREIDSFRVGRHGVELTVGDRVVRCDALSQFPKVFPLSHSRRRSLELTARWLDETQTWYSLPRTPAL